MIHVPLNKIGIGFNCHKLLKLSLFAQEIGIIVKVVLLKCNTERKFGIFHTVKSILTLVVLETS